MSYANALTTIVVALAMTTVAWAAPPNGQQPGGHLRIAEVLVDFDLESMTIVMEDLDFGPGPVEVTFGDAGDIGDISDLCIESLLTSPQTIDCDFSTDGLPADGDYLVTVSTGAGQSQSDEYDLTIGAVGPQGDKGAKGDTGETGATGLDGVSGPTGPTGAAGPIGAAGVTGATGPVGANGSTGSTGSTGATGPQGPGSRYDTFTSSAFSSCGCTPSGSAQRACCRLSSAVGGGQDPLGCVVPFPPFRGRSQCGNFTFGLSGSCSAGPVGVTCPNVGGTQGPSELTWCIEGSFGGGDSCNGASGVTGTCTDTASDNCDCSPNFFGCGVSCSTTATGATQNKTLLSSRAMCGEIEP